VTQNWKVVIMYTGNTTSIIVLGSWIYYCLCNQCLSPLKLWVRSPFMVKCTRYNIMW